MPTGSWPRRTIRIAWPTSALERSSRPLAASRSSRTPIRPSNACADCSASLNLQNRPCSRETDRHEPPQRSSQEEGRDLPQQPLQGRDEGPAEEGPGACEGQGPASTASEEEARSGGG